MEIERLKNEIKTLHVKLDESNKAKTVEQPQRQLKQTPTIENKPKKIVTPNKQNSSTFTDTLIIVIFGIVVLAAIITFKKMLSKV